ncbi:MAG: calcium-binding protein, partial [Cyanobacteriota bacterium]
MTGPSLGTNLHALVDWTTAFPLLDLFRQSRPWYTQTDGVFDTEQEGLLDLDDHGWVRGFTQTDSTAPFSRVATILFTSDAGVVKPGTYELVWKGSGELNLDFVPGSQIVSRETNRIVFSLTQGPIQISIGSTDPLNTGDYIRDIQLYNTEHRELVQAGFQFAPDFLEKISDFRVLRFMDWMNTNNSPPGEVSGLRPQGFARETNYESDQRGVSVETMVALANEAKADPWFTLPHTASDATIRAFATYVRDHLEPSLAARFELSNEVWNFIFPQSQFALEQGALLFGDQAIGSYMQWYGMRAAQMAEIVADVFGAATGNRALNVFATQAFNLGLEQHALDAPDLVAGGGTAPREALFHIYAIAPYFGGSIGSEEMASEVNRWAGLGEAGLQEALTWLRSSDAEDSLARVGDVIRYHAAVANSLGWQLEAYEGGQHIVDLNVFFGGGTTPARTAFFSELVRHPQFYDLYETYFNLWRDAGGGMMAHFSDFGADSQFGSWGIWESSHAPDSSRAAAVVDFRDTVPAWWADPRDATTFQNGRLAVDSAGLNRMVGTAFADRLSALEGDNTLIGRAGDDWLAARGGNDTLNGGRGRDRLAGGDGNDTYIVDNAGDVVVEAVNAGIDTVRASVSHTLAANVEHLMLTGNRAINGTGTGLANTITGNAAANGLDGGAGVDQLTGGGGADRFGFRFGQSRIRTPDRITDFRFGQDKITLLNGLGVPLPLPAAFSRAADNSTASTLAALADAVFADANGAAAGNQPLAANAAALVRSTNAAIAGTYLLIN